MLLGGVLTCFPSPKRLVRLTLEDTMHLCIGNVFNVSARLVVKLANGCWLSIVYKKHLSWIWNNNDDYIYSFICRSFLVLVHVMFGQSLDTWFCWSVVIIVSVSSRFPGLGRSLREHWQKGASFYIADNGACNRHAVILQAVWMYVIQTRIL